ncbi:MAG: hypothetical protein EBU90_01440 [Proteobacteria bacterium]|nr:hypothetical protein [Pseudomonadota bacterium]
MNSINLTPFNWKKVKSELLDKLELIARKSDFKLLSNSRNFNEFFQFLFKNYGWLKTRHYEIEEIETITLMQYSQFFIWLLETYCLGKGVDNVVKDVIDLHKRRLDGDEPTKQEWETAKKTAKFFSLDATWYAASATSIVDAWEAAFDATLQGAGSIAWKQISNKLIEIIYK